MLPIKLCDLCSLTPSADKLAFSLIVELDSEAEIVSHKFTKSVIRSCTQFAYHHAQVNKCLNYYATVSIMLMRKYCTDCRK